MNWKYYYFKEADSTNNLAADYPAGSVIMAETQTAGRGRYGRQWVSFAGNLFLSAVLPDNEKSTPYLPFAAALCVAEALKQYGYQTHIKWPNDILWNGQKVAGILLERTEKNTVIIGIGVNLVQAPTENTLYPVTALNASFTPKELAVKIIDALNLYYNELIKNGFEPIREKWMQFALGIGSFIRVSLPRETVRGIFEELTPQGAISLKLQDKTQRIITVGDVFFEKEEK